MSNRNIEGLFCQTPVIASAVISECGNYRYSLTRIWDESKPKVMFIMLNPSTADANNDDPTIRRCVGFAKSWGFGGLYVCNLFAFRATTPKELLKVDNPFGDQNIWHTRKLSDEVEMIICAWGNYPIVKKILRYENAPINLLDFCINKLHSIDTTVKGIPKHPLYLKSELKPKRWAYNAQFIPSVHRSTNVEFIPSAHLA